MVFAWNIQKVKSRYLHPELGRPVQVEVPAIDILRNPNRHQMESVLSAVAVTLVELVRLQEESAARIQAMMNLTGETNEIPSKLSSGTGSKQSRRSKKSSVVPDSGGSRDPQSTPNT